MADIIVKNKGVKSELEIPDQPFTVLVHQQGLKVEAPDFLLIDARATQKCMEEMSQRAWVHISTGELFRHIFGVLFKDCNDVYIPSTIKELIEDCDPGVIHGCGLIVLGCEAMFEGKNKVFFRNPEDLLHPKVERNLVEALRLIGSLADIPPEIEVLPPGPYSISSEVQEAEIVGAKNEN